MTIEENKVKVYILLLILGILTCVINSPWVLMAFCTLIFILIFLRAKYSFYSVLSFIMLFSYMQVVIYKSLGICAGMLSQVGRTVPFYFREMSIATISFFLTALFFVWFTNIVVNEKRIYLKGPNLNLFTAIVFLTVAIILVLLVFPSFPTFKMETSIRRTQGISGTYGFVLLSLILCALTIDTSFKHKFFTAGYLFIAFWIFGHAERVEVLGFLIYYVLKLLNHYDEKARKDRLLRIEKSKFLRNEDSIGKTGRRYGHKKAMLFMAAAGVLLLCVWIGLTRNKDVEVSFTLLLNKLFLQGTCGDVLYIFDCAIDMWKNGNLTHGYTYIDYLLQLIPGATIEYAASSVIKNYYFTMGGAFFFVEPMMNFGMIGTIISNVAFFSLMSLITRKTTTLKVYMWTPIVIEIFRTMWYGRSGWILAFFIEMPLLYLGVKYTLNKIRIKS